jgi:hypothetical protein
MTRAPTQQLGWVYTEKKERTQVTLEVVSTGTPYGISRMLEIAWGCPRRAYLAEYHERSADAERPEPTKPNPLLVGSITHRILAHMYSSGEMPHPEDVRIKSPQFSKAALDVCVPVALDLYDMYVMSVPLNEWTVIDVERFFRVGQENHEFLWPYTGRWDLVVELDDKQARDFRQSSGVSVWAGRWLVDHKTARAHTAQDIDRYQASLQGIAYIEAYNALHPDTPVEGMIYNILTKTRPRVETCVRFNVTANERLQLASTVRRAKSVCWPLSESTALECNPGHCFANFSTCSFRASGICLGV